jgi:hypothetical protein
MTSLSARMVLSAVAMKRERYVGYAEDEFGATASLCADCGWDTTPLCGASEWYMVHGEVWKAARMPERGFLCIECLETRLDRQLRAADFTDCLANDPSSRCHTQRLRDRLRRRSPHQP